MMKEAVRDYFSPLTWVRDQIRKRSILHQIRKLIERNEAMLQNLDTLTSTLSSISGKLSDLIAAQQEATQTAVAAGVNAALGNAQTQVDAMLASAQSIEKALSDAVAAAKG